MTEKYYNLLKDGLIPVGERKIIKLGSDRYLIYLPRSLKHIWDEFNQRNKKVRVYIEVVK